MMRRPTAFWGAAAASAFLLAGAEAGWCFTTQRVVYLVIDGPRDTEFLEDSTHAHIPNIWDVLRPQGFVSHGLYNNGPTQTMSGHAMLGTGAYQNIVNDGTQRPTKPLLWEYLRDQWQLPDSSCVNLTGKTKLNALSYSTAPGYGVEDSAVTLGPYASDREIVRAFMAYAPAAEPVVSMLCLSDVDESAHTGNRERYLAAIETADSLALDLWSWIEQTPPFAGVTAFIVTADHGRHDGDWTQHGCDCHGCKHLPLVALGPDILAGVELSEVREEIWDVATTLGWVLGLDMPQAEGRYLMEMLQGESTPPMPPVVGIQVQTGLVVLSWSPVTVDIEGNPESVSCYRVYRGASVSFIPDEASLIAGSVLMSRFTDPDTSLVGNPAIQAFYRVSAVDIWSNESEPSNLVGEFDFSTGE